MTGAVRLLPGGGLRVTLTRREHAALAALPAQLRAVIDGSANTDLAEAVRSRLFPRAYDDDELDAEYRRLVSDELVQGRLDQLDLFESTLQRPLPPRGKVKLDLDPDEASAWLAVVNDTRLLLGAALGITDESHWDGEPDASDPASVLLWYLGWLEESLVTAMMGSL